MTEKYTHPVARNEVEPRRNLGGFNTYLLKRMSTKAMQNFPLAREAHFPATIADLYKPDAMPKNLCAAHERNDEVVERTYIGGRFKNDTERLEKLFELYTKMTTKIGGSKSL